jgi:glycine/D-amino acid oxidase-like deaminating enzyme
MARVHTCAHAGCGVRLILAKGPLGRRFPPLNGFEDPLGTVAAQHLASGAWAARFLAAGEEPVVPEKRYSVHTCPGSERKAQREAWQGAIGAHNAGQRRGRGRRAEKPVTGYVVQPPQLPGMGE